MTVPGIVLSHPLSAITASNRKPRVHNSMESAITSRLTSEQRIASVPIEMPSETEMVLNSNGTPPAARTPSLTFSASFSRWTVHGLASIQVLAMATSGLWCSSSSPRPTARNIARAPARDWPSVMMPERIFSFDKSVLIIVFS